MKTKALRVERDGFDSSPSLSIPLPLNGARHYAPARTSGPTSAIGGRTSYLA
jgi:hypothetical protein